MTNKSPQNLLSHVQSAAKSIREHTSFVPKLGAVLGSGLGYLAEQIEDRIVIPYEEIHGFPLPSVPGHQGKLVLGTLAQMPVAFLAGRIHLYEGFSAQEVVFPVRVLRQLGAEFILITNAAGGININYAPGDLMLLDDQLNLTHQNPLTGPNIEEWGPRFPDMGGAFDKELKEIATRVAQNSGIDLKKGVYAGFTGPSYETPAEIRMLRTIGADAVGMSTVLEVIAARHLGMRTLAISCIANLAADIHQGELSHEEVTEAVESRREAFGTFLKDIIEELNKNTK